MNSHAWQLAQPIDTIVFDCDGTLSTIEGIDELAKTNGASQLVKALTEAAMGQLGMNLELYEKRLQLVHPSQSDVIQLAKEYFTHRVPDVEPVLDIYKTLKKNIYIVSAGLLPSVCAFGEKLHIPKENITAVNIEFDEQGRFKDFDRSSPLVTSNGKRLIISELKSRHPDIIFVGDGLNDLVALDLVKRFIGYGGAFYRENIAKQCQFYINTSSLSALLPLTITFEEYQSLSPLQKKMYEKGFEAIETKKVAIS